MIGWSICMHGSKMVRERVSQDLLIMIIIIFIGTKKTKLMESSFNISQEKTNVKEFIMKMEMLVNGKVMTWKTSTVETDGNFY